MNAADELQEEIKSLTEELEYYMDKCKMLEQIINSNHEKEKSMHKVFLLQEAELQRLRDSNA